MCIYQCLFIYQSYFYLFNGAANTIYQAMRDLSRNVKQIRTLFTLQFKVTYFCVKSTVSYLNVTECTQNIDLMKLKLGQWFVPIEVIQTNLLLNYNYPNDTSLYYIQNNLIIRVLLSSNPKSYPTLKYLISL